MHPVNRGRGRPKLRSIEERAFMLNPRLENDLDDTVWATERAG